MPFGIGQKKKINQFTTIMITPLGQSKAGAEQHNEEKFRVLDALADDTGTSAGTQVIDLAKKCNMSIQRCVRLAQEMEGGGWVRQVSSNES